MVSKFSKGENKKLFHCRGLAKLSYDTSLKDMKKENDEEKPSWLQQLNDTFFFSSLQDG